MFDSGDEDKRVAKFADESMFIAQPAEGRTPRVTLLDAPNDPLGKMAQLAQIYQGIAKRSLVEISDRDRQYYITDMEKNVLGFPSESVMFHFLIENVSRSFTHQLVRTRIGIGYGQESLRFAVKEDFPVGLPPHLMGTKSVDQEVMDFADQMGWVDLEGFVSVNNYDQALATVRQNASQIQQERFKFDERNDQIRTWYLDMIDNGWPAEDARGILPHWILTKVNMAVTLSTLMGMAGKRLCTQAQFEHKMVWDGIIASIRDFGAEVSYRTNDPTRPLNIFEFEKEGRTGSQEFDVASPEFYSLTEVGDSNGDQSYERSSAWQYEVLANRFKPICYQTGKCQFMSDFDRYCNIRDRVQANAAINRPSSEWHKEHYVVPAEEIMVGFDGSQIVRTELDIPAFIPAIAPAEWLHPKAAIRPDGSWRSEQAKKNIEGRRL